MKYHIFMILLLSFIFESEKYQSDWILGGKSGSTKSNTATIICSQEVWLLTLENIWRNSAQLAYADLLPNGHRWDCFQPSRGLPPVPCWGGGVGGGPDLNLPLKWPRRGPTTLATMGQKRWAIDVLKYMMPSIFPPCVTSFPSFTSDAILLRRNFYQFSNFYHHFCHFCGAVFSPSGAPFHPVPDAVCCPQLSAGLRHKRAVI